MMGSLFTKIINREIPAHIVAEDENFIAFLDINPLTDGHTLVVPKKEVDYIFDLDDKTLSEINLFCKRVAKAIEKSVSCLRVGIAVVGLEIPHTHIHLIPLNSMEDINFNKEKLDLSEEQLSETAKKINDNLD